MGSLVNLAVRLEKKADAIGESASQRTVRIATAILADLVQVTPVDTSKALSNWQIGLGHKPAKRLPPFVSGRRGSTQEASAARAIQKGISILAAKKPGQTVYISNLTAYIADLNRGTSSQFAGNFAARARLVAANVLTKEAVS